VWMYLPGVNSRSDIGLLYGQARRVVEKLENGALQSSNGKHDTNGTSHAARQSR